MRLSFDTYWPLLLLLIIPYFWWVQRRTLTDLSSKHLQLSAAVRSLVVILIAVAMAQPTLYRSGSWISVVYLLDVSGSVAPASIQSALQWIQETNNAGHPDHARFVPFAANSTVFETLDQLKKVEVTNRSSSDSIDQSAT